MMLFCTVFSELSVPFLRIVAVYSRTSMARTLMAHIPCLTFLGPCGPIYETSVVKFLHLCFYAVISLKIENENNSRKTLTTELSYMGMGF